MAAQTNGQPAAADAVYSNGIPQTYPSRMFSVLSSYPNKSSSYLCPLPDALHLSIPAQGLPNGDAALPHAAYPGMQPYPGVGKWKYSKSISRAKKNTIKTFLQRKKKFVFNCLFLYIYYEINIFLNGNPTLLNQYSFDFRFLSFLYFCWFY